MPATVCRVKSRFSSPAQLQIEVCVEGPLEMAGCKHRGSRTCIEEHERVLKRDQSFRRNERTIRCVQACYEPVIAIKISVSCTGCRGGRLGGVAMHCSGERGSYST